MKKLKLLTALFSLLIFATSLSAQAAEPIETAKFTENNTNDFENEIIPRTLITATNVLKWSEKNNFQIQADIVTNDGTGKIIDIKNIQLKMHTDKVKEISLSHGEIWENGSYATVTITYRDKDNNICTDIAKFYPYGN